MASDALTQVLNPENPQIQAYRQQAPELLGLAESLQITSDDGLREAAEHTKAASSAVKAIKAMFKPAKAALDEAKRSVSALESGLLAGFERADAILRAKVTDYNRKRLREIEEQRRALEAEARRKREDEQVAQAARLENMARQTGEQHYQRAADMVLNAPIRTPVVNIEKPKVKGLTFREETGIQVVDRDALFDAVARGDVPREAFMPDGPWLRQQAVNRGTAVKDGDLLFPGVLVTKTDDVTVRTK